MLFDNGLVVNIGPFYLHKDFNGSCKFTGIVNLEACFFLFKQWRVSLTLTYY